MAEKEIKEIIREIKKKLVDGGYVRQELFEAGFGERTGPFRGVKIDSALDYSGSCEDEIETLADFISTEALSPIQERERRLMRAEEFSEVLDFLVALLDVLGPLRVAPAFVKVYGELLELFISVLYFSGRPGLESPIIRLILETLSRQKAVESNRYMMTEAIMKLGATVTVAIIAKRYGVYVLAAQGFKILLRSEIDFRIFGKSPEALALQIINMLMKSGVKLSDVTDLVCVGGDLGALPDGIYVLTEQVRDESWRRLNNSSLNRGALITWELKELLQRQAGNRWIHASLCSPLSFSTLNLSELTPFYRQESGELRQSLKGYVKVTPLKALSALLSAILPISRQRQNLLVMALDELHASVVRKIGPRIVREMAAQDANRTLIDFDFGKILEAIKGENFPIPPNFCIGSLTDGTGAKEVCEMIMIIDSGRISTSLARNLNHVVNSFARKVAMALKISSTGTPAERPDFIIITSMMAFDPCFRKLFVKIRDMIDTPLIPIMCLESLEHEYLIARHLFRNLH